MKMEMNYRDKVILIVLLIVLIVVAGIMALIKPQYEDYKAAKAEYETVLKDWEAVEEKINAIDPLRKDITATYQEANKTAAVFVNSIFETANKTYGNEKTSMEIDQFLQPIIDECSLNVTGMDIAPVAAETMTYYYYVPDVVTYSLLEAADINGTYAATIGEALQMSTVLAQREAVEVMSEVVSVTVEGKKEDLMLFLEKIDADPNAVLVKTVAIDNYEFTDGLEQESIGADGQTVITIDPNGIGTSEITIEIAFYNAKDMEKPDLGE